MAERLTEERPAEKWPHITRVGRISFELHHPTCPIEQARALHGEDGLMFGGFTPRCFCPGQPNVVQPP